MNKQYGQPPVVIKQIDLEPSEMMFTMYLPIVLKNGGCAIPNNLKYLETLVYTALDNMPNNNEYNVYVTAKTLFVQPGMSGNRPGWHVDGYGSNGDINYIWYDMNPTEFAVQSFVDIPDDDIESMKAMEKQIQPDKIITYPCRTLLRLNESVVHRVSENIQPGIRTFIKISFSKHKYNLKGNAHNYLLDYDWEMFDRYPDRRNVDNKDYAS